MRRQLVVAPQYNAKWIITVLVCSRNEVSSFLTRRDRTLTRPALSGAVAGLPVADSEDPN